MSHLSDALAAFDRLSEDEWGWFAPKGMSRRRSEFRQALREGRVDPLAVTANVEAARAAQAAQEAAYAALDKQVDMPILRKGAGWLPNLRVVG